MSDLFKFTSEQNITDRDINTWGVWEWKDGRYGFTPLGFSISVGMYVYFFSLDGKFVKKTRYELLAEDWH